MKFKEKKERTQPEINTSALPDIIFMLLFFFMVATVLKSNPEKTQFTLPTAEERSEMKVKDGLIQIYVPKLEEESSTTIQVNEYLIDLKMLENVLVKIKAEQITTEIKVSMKVDRLVPMGTIHEIKTILRKLDLRKLQYVTLPKE